MYLCSKGGIMVEEKHIKQVSIEKVDKYVSDLYKEILQNINLTTNYFNDLEQAVVTVILGNKILEVCKESLGEENVQRILKIVEQERGKLKENGQTKTNSKKEW